MISIHSETMKVFAVEFVSIQLNLIGHLLHVTMSFTQSVSFHGYKRVRDRVQPAVISLLDLKTVVLQVILKAVVQVILKALKVLEAAVVRVILKVLTTVI